MNSRIGLNLPFSSCYKTIVQGETLEIVNSGARAGYRKIVIAALAFFQKSLNPLSFHSLFRM
jgi:hypothetical protein